MSVPALNVAYQGISQTSADQLNTFMQTCNVITDLRAFVGITGMKVFMGGYVAEGDGGQGNFYWNASGTGPDDNGVTNIVPTGAALGCWTRLGIPNNTFSVLPPTFRNGLINGDMTVVQRGTSFTGINGTTPIYTVDRWFGWTSGPAGNMSLSQQSGVASNGFNNVLRVQRTASSTSTALQSVAQIIETKDCYRFQGQSCILSFYVRSGANFSSALAKINIGVQQGTGADQGSSSAILATWTNQSVALSTSQIITSTLTRFSFPVSIVSTATEIIVLFSYTGVGTAGASDYFEITGVQLETGAITAYEYLPYGVNIDRCQRYTPVFGGVTGPIGTGAADTTSSAGFFIPFRVSTRIAPTGLTIGTVGDFEIATYGGSDNSALNGITFNKASTDGIFVTTTIAGTSLTSTSPYFLYAKTALSGNLVFTGAEL